MTTTKRTITGIVIAVMMLAAIGAGVPNVMAGNLTPPEAPGSTMKTLQQIWDKLEDIEAQTRRNAEIMMETAQAQGLAWRRTWETVVVDSDNAGWYSSLAFSPEGRPCIAYSGLLPEYVRFASFNGTSWQIADVDTSAEMKHFTSLAFSPEGYPAIAYWAQNPGELRYAARTNRLGLTVQWGITVVDPAQGEYASLAFRPNGTPCISYYHRGHTDLFFAECVAGVWQTGYAVRSSSGDVGMGSAMVIPPSGNPMIAYSDTTSDVVSFIEHDGTNWSSPINAGGPKSTDISMALNPANLPMVAYYDASAKRLRASQNNGAIFQNFPITTNTWVGQYNSLAFSPEGYPAISYFDDNIDRLTYAEYRFGEWHIMTIDPDEGGGRHTSLAFTPDGRPAISHYDGRLKYTVATGYEIVP